MNITWVASSVPLVLMAWRWNGSAHFKAQTAVQPLGRAGQHGVQHQQAATGLCGGGLDRLHQLLPRPRRRTAGATITLQTSARCAPFSGVSSTNWALPQGLIALDSHEAQALAAPAAVLAALPKGTRSVLARRCRPADAGAGATVSRSSGTGAAGSRSCKAAALDWFLHPSGV
ncbi:MAG: hypothetical protein U1E77_13565 [Inhella sp.]